MSQSDSDTVDGPHVVLVACADDTQYVQALDDAAGSDQAVLPYRRPGVGDVIERFADHLGVGVQRVSASDLTGIAPRISARPHPTTGGPVVVGLAGCGRSATTFAALTGRALIDDVVDVGAALSSVAQASSVTVVPPPTWTAAELTGVLRSSRLTSGGPPIGFLYPFGETEREAFILKSVLFGRLGAGREAGRYRFCFPLEAASSVCRDDDVDVVIGRGDGAVATRALLESPGDFLFATPHSNGVNLGLGDVVLCSREDHPADAPVPARSVPCFATGTCAKKGPRSMLLGAKAVRSSIVFLQTCYGVLLADSPYDVGASLAGRFAESSFNVALLTTHTMSRLDRAAGLFVADLLRSGRSIGEATLLVNREHARRYGDVEEAAVLFGDPELRLGPGAPVTPALAADPVFAAFVEATGLVTYGVDPVHQRSRPPTRTASSPSPQTYAAIDYARCTVVGSRSLPGRTLTEPIARLAACTEALWAASLVADARTARAGGADLPAGTRGHLTRRLLSLHDAWVEYTAALVANAGGYVRLQTDRFFRPDGEPEPRTCPHCRGPARLATVRLADDRDVRRRLLECPACATVADAVPPAILGGLQMAPTVVAGEPLPIAINLEVIGSGTVPVTAAAFLEPFDKSISNGSPSTSFESAGLRPAVRRLSVDLAGGTVEVKLPTIAVPTDTPAGVHFIDAVVLVGAAPTMLRRHLTVLTQRNEP